MDHRRCLPLSLGQDDIREFFIRRDNCDFLEVVIRHFGDSIYLDSLELIDISLISLAHD